MKKIYLLTLACLLCQKIVLAQDQQLITYHGQFRTLISDNRLMGNILDGDSLSNRRGATGSIFLDLGIHVKPNEDFKLLAEFRLRNVIGQDQNQNGVTLITGNSLIDSRMIFRQVRAEGNIKKVVQYQIGDIDLGLTPYTLFNNEEMFSTYESDIFKERRVIAHYENFQTGNLWRLQGVSAKTQINFKGPLRRIDANLFGARTRQNSLLGVPDRYLVGGKLDVTQSKFLTLGVNWVNMFDVAGTALNDTLTNYNNQVLTLNYKITPLNKGTIELNMLGENGISENNYFVAVVDTTSHKRDFFIDAGIRAVYKPIRLELTASYINVGHNFTSPGAQTLRLRPTDNPLYFPMVNNASTTRALTVFDRLSDESIYNQRIHPGLMPFVPVYGNVLPYGAATPNRKGFVFNLGRAVDTSYTVSFNVGGAMLSENVSEGDSIGKQLRKFTQLKGGISLHVSKLIGFKKTILLSTGARYENTSREGSAFIDFSSLLLDAGLTLETVKGIYLMGGVKYIQGEGTEVITQRDIFGTISGYSPYLYDADQLLVSGGIKLALFKNSFASVEYNRLMLNDNTDSTQDYSMGNLFINFTLRF